MALLGLVTVNKRRQHAGFVNGQLAEVVQMSPPHAPTEIKLRLLDEPEGAPLLAMRRESSSTAVGGVSYTRRMFPLIPAYSSPMPRTLYCIPSCAVFHLSLIHI